MKIEGSRCRNFVALILVLVLGLTMAVSGHAAPAPAEPDPETLSRLTWAETSGGEALLIGTNIEVGKERPERIFPSGSSRSTAYSRVGLWSPTPLRRLPSVLPKGL